MNLNHVYERIDELGEKLKEIEELLKTVIRNQRQDHRYPHSHPGGYKGAAHAEYLKRKMRAGR